MYPRQAENAAHGPTRRSSRGFSLTTTDPNYNTYQRTPVGRWVLIASGSICIVQKCNYNEYNPHIRNIFPPKSLANIEQII
ncbi:hypothetical protein RSAG8_12766, partial [Rhizoctonia solani AG-8 WAC10335]